MTAKATNAILQVATPHLPDFYVDPGIWTLVLTPAGQSLYSTSCPPSPQYTNFMSSDSKELCGTVPFHVIPKCSFMAQDYVFKSLGAVSFHRTYEPWSVYDKEETVYLAITSKHCLSRRDRRANATRTLCFRSCICSQFLREGFISVYYSRRQPSTATPPTIYLDQRRVARIFLWSVSTNAHKHTQRGQQ